MVWLDGRLKALEKELAQAGSHPKQLTDLLGYLHGDVQGMAELALLHREAVWQLEAIAHGCLRRWPQLLERAGPMEQAVAGWCQACSTASDARADAPAAVTAAAAQGA